MACFLVPCAEAVVTTIASKVMKKNEAASRHTENTIAFSEKLGWLNKMLWGGSALLAFEHVWHGEVTPWFPFLTAAANPEDLAEMLGEMSTVGVSMAAIITVVWVGMLIVSRVMEKKAEHADDLAAAL